MVGLVIAMTKKVLLACLPDKGTDQAEEMEKLILMKGFYMLMLIDRTGRLI